MGLTSISLTSGMRANLFSLQQTAKDFEITQTRLATGLKVNTALDDPVSFFTAQEHRLRATDLASRKDGMSEAIQTIKAANVGVENITTLIAQAKSLAQSALSATATDASTFSDQYATVMDQINAMASDSDYKGINLLQAAELTVQFAATANESTLKLTGFGGETSFDITGLSAELSNAGTNWVTGSGASAAVDVDAINVSIAGQMINTLNDGASKLTEADMNEEGANMLMLQTRQALGTTSLSLASQAAQGVLRLF
jgi:flagellin